MRPSVMSLALVGDAGDRRSPDPRGTEATSFPQMAIPIPDPNAVCVSCTMHQSVSGSLCTKGP